MEFKLGSFLQLDIRSLEHPKHSFLLGHGRVISSGLQHTQPTISFREASVKLTGDPGTQTVWGTVLLKLMDEGGRCIDYIPFLPGPHSSDKHMHIRIPMTWEHQAGRASVSLVSTYHQCSDY